MPAKPSYEPSVQSVAQEILPQALLIAGDPASLRWRVSWPVIARSTGLGRLEGGEIVLAASPRSSDIAARADELVREGVVMAILVGDVSSEDIQTLRQSNLPAALAPAGIDLGELRSDLERFIARKRRDLFALDGELHRTLIEASIAGASLRDLVFTAAGYSRSLAFLQRDGELIVAPAEADVSAELLHEVRDAVARPGVSHVLIAGALASPVTSGRDVRGVVGFTNFDMRELDALEAVVVNLASACAIALSREPAQRLPSLAEVQAQPPEGLLDGSPWVAGAIRSSSSSIDRLKRVLGAEFEARGVAHVLVWERETPVLLASVDERFPWDAVLGAASLRLSASEFRMGLSRQQIGSVDIGEAVRQAFEALSRGSAGRVTRYEWVELDALLGSLKGAEAFVTARLGPLLDGSTSSDELLLTLATYLETGRNAKEAASRLAVHRNTLIYRLRRLDEILGIDWEDADGVFALDLALRLQKRTAIGSSGSGSHSK